LVEPSSNFDRSLCRAAASEMELMVLKILVSLANVAIFELVTALEISPMNNNGPRMDPCGTPDVIMQSGFDVERLLAGID
jgi:hypothetical protein